MAEKLVDHLIERLRTLELHAAHSGREVTHVLVECALKSNAKDIGSLTTEIKQYCEEIIPVLPPYAPPLNSMNRVLLALENGKESNQDVKDVRKELAALRDVSELANKHRQMVAFLQPALPEKVKVYTHTLSETLMGVLLALNNAERIDRVYVTESRPNNDGWITAKKLAEAGVPTQLTVDMAFTAAIDQADVMFSGTEMIDASGSAVCKVGVYPAAMYCHLTSKPVFIVAGTEKMCAFTPENIEMTPVSLEDLGFSQTPEELAGFGSYFDVTPAKYINGYVTEKGILDLEAITTFINNQPVSQWLSSVI
jgi:ribose 1,5-bisphosphate isomerase